MALNDPGCRWAVKPQQTLCLSWLWPSFFIGRGSRDGDDSQEDDYESDESIYNGDSIEGAHQSIIYSRVYYMLLAKFMFSEIS